MFEDSTSISYFESEISRFVTFSLYVVINAGTGVRENEIREKTIEKSSEMFHDYPPIGRRLFEIVVKIFSFCLSRNISVCGLRVRTRTLSQRYRHIHRIDRPFYSCPKRTCCNKNTSLSSWRGNPNGISMGSEASMMEHIPRNWKVTYERCRSSGWPRFLSQTSGWLWTDSTFLPIPTGPVTLLIIPDSSSPQSHWAWASWFHFIRFIQYGKREIFLSRELGHGCVSGGLEEDYKPSNDEREEYHIHLSQDML